MSTRVCAAAAALTVSAGLLLGGCGQKGPLYLPEKRGTAVTSPPSPPAPVPAGQPQQPSPAPQPQSTPESPPPGAAPPPKDPTTDDDQKHK
jgi:predicted small lipoprotein YifL